jgi:hypothetical protein
VTAIAALLEKHENKVPRKPSKYVSSCTITRANRVEHEQDLSKAVSILNESLLHRCFRDWKFLFFYSATGIVDFEIYYSI